MRRVLIVLVALALLAAMPGTAAAGKPVDCDKTPNHPACTPPEDPPDCIFVDGRLEGWPEDNSYRCVLAVKPGQTLTFRMEGAGRVQTPHLLVTGGIPYGEPFCFNQWDAGWFELPYPLSGWMVNLSSGDCQTYGKVALNVSGKARGDVGLFAKP